MRLRLPLAVAGIVGSSMALTGIASAGPSADEKKFCKAVVSLNLYRGQPEEPDPEKLGELLEPVEQNAPADLSDEVITAAMGVRQGNLTDPSVAAALAAVDEWIIANCGYEVVEVTGSDFEFEGIPKRLTTGVVLFEFTNEGAELHELVLDRLLAGQSVEELVGLPVDELLQQEVGFAFAEQGQTDVAYVKFTKTGRYAAVCFIPVGSLEVGQAGEGVPHHDEGMVTEFKVTRKGKGK